MSDEFEFEKVISKPRYDLPISYTREIGRVVVRWAHFEQLIQTIIWSVAFNADESGASLGRLSILELKFPDRLEMLKRLADVRNIGFDTTLLRKLKTKSKKLSEKRNLLSHGSWTKTPRDGWVVRQTRGRWEDRGYGPSGSKKVMPEAIPTRAKDIAKVASDLEALIADARRLMATFHYKPTN